MKQLILIITTLFLSVTSFAQDTIKIDKVRTTNELAKDIKQRYKIIKHLNNELKTISTSLKQDNFINDNQIVINHFLYDLAEIKRYHIDIRYKRNNNQEYNLQLYLKQLDILEMQLMTDKDKDYTLYSIDNFVKPVKEPVYRIRR